MSETHGTVIGWRLDPERRAELLSCFPPKWPNVVADHVTLAAANLPPTAQLPDTAKAYIVGRIDDGAGVEALVVRLGGTTERPGGGTYHITWSLAAGRQAKESNDVLAEHSWTEISPPVPVNLTPARWP